MKINLIGILCALPEEEAFIIKEMQNLKNEEYAGVTYRCGQLCGINAVVCCGGMGKANAASTTQVLITKFGADAIIFSGIAGNMSGRVGLGDVVLGKTVCYHDATDNMLSQSAPGTAEYTADPVLTAALEEGCKKTAINYVVGKIATGDKFIGDAQTKKEIDDYCKPDCVEMEGAAVGQTAMRNNVPFAIVRAMSDNADAAVHDALGSGKQQEFLISEYTKKASAIVLNAVAALAKQ